MTLRWRGRAIWVSAPTAARASYHRVTAEQAICYGAEATQGRTSAEMALPGAVCLQRVYTRRSLLGDSPGAHLQRRQRSGWHAACYTLNCLAGGKTRPIEPCPGGRERRRRPR